jgi:CIC family chloride channel protein
VTAYSIFTTVFGQGHLFAVRADYVFEPHLLPLYATMAVLLAGFGLLWIKTFYGVERRVFARVRAPRWLKPAIGGLALGMLALAIPHCLGIGYGWVQDALRDPDDVSRILPIGWRGAGLLLGIGLAKMLATSLTVGSGGSGGVFAPSIVIGGLLGGAFGLAMHTLMPQVVTQPSKFVLVGMASFYAGVGHVPLAALVIVCELAGSYDLLVPLMLGVMITYLLLRRHSLYEKQVKTAKDSPAHLGDFTVDVLEDLRVVDAYDRRTQGLSPVRQDMRLREFLDHVSSTAEWFFPVVDSGGTLCGVVSLPDVRAVVGDPGALDIVVVGDAMAPLVTVAPRASLRTALGVFMKCGYSQLPVVDPATPQKVVGLLSQQDLIGAYNAEILRRRVAPATN